METKRIQLPVILTNHRLFVIQVGAKIFIIQEMSYDYLVDDTKPDFATFKVQTSKESLISFIHFMIFATSTCGPRWIFFNLFLYKPAFK